MLRNATYWMQLHEVAEAIRDRFEAMDSHAAVSARIRDLRKYCGLTIVHRRRAGSNADEYMMVSGYAPQPPQGDMFSGGAA